MQLSLTRVRLAFFGLAIMLLVGVLSLLDSALARLERERRLRHEVVAERVFDELERELNAHLERESTRPSVAYDAPSSQVDAWAPFVVGYFTVANDYRVLSREQLTPARTARIDAALAHVWPDPARSHPGSSAPVVAVGAPSDAAAGHSYELSKLKPNLNVEPSEKSAPARLKSAKALDNSPEVLRRLNRAQQARQSQSQTKQDPFAY